jgi:hypothetical protein
MLPTKYDDTFYYSNGCKRCVLPETALAFCNHMTREQSRHSNHYRCVRKAFSTIYHQLLHDGTLTKVKVLDAKFTMESWWSVTHMTKCL